MGTSIARRLRDVKLGSRIFGGQSTNRDRVPFPDSRGTWILFRQEATIVRETPAHWIDDSGDWWRKRDGLAAPAGPTRIHLVPVDNPDRRVD